MFEQRVKQDPGRDAEGCAAVLARASLAVWKGLASIQAQHGSTKYLPALTRTSSTLSFSLIRLLLFLFAGEPP